MTTTADCCSAEWSDLWMIFLNFVGGGGRDNKTVKGLHLLFTIWMLGVMTPDSYFRRNCGYFCLTEITKYV